MRDASAAVAERTGSGSDRPLRILLASASSGSRGGGEIYLLGLARGLRALGHEVVLLLADHARMDALAALAAEDASVRRVPYRGTYERRTRLLGSLLDRRGIARMAAVFASAGADIVHVNKQNLEDGLDLLEAGRRSGVPLVATIHITRTMRDLGAVAGGLRDRVARRVLGRPGGEYVVIAGTGRGDLENFLGPRGAGRIHLVTNGVAAAPAADRAALRAAWGVPEGGVLLGCVARIEEQKNPLLLLRVLARLPDHVRLVWIGDGRLRGAMEAEVRARGLASRVRIDGWREDAAAAAAGFDLFVLPSRFEGLPLALLEAMAGGLPCVVSDTDGTREAVVDGVCGRLLPPGDEDAWTAALGEAAADPALRARWGAAARERHRAEFTLERMAERTAAVYRGVLARAAGRVA